MKRLTQDAPYPDELEDLVSKLKYREGWRFSLSEVERDSGTDKHGYGLTFTAVGTYPDSYHPEVTIRVRHDFIVPAATYNRQSWQRWLLERLLDVERHECCEFFQIDGERPYAPNHGPGFDPYAIRELTTEEDRRTSFRGELKEAPDGA